MEKVGTPDPFRARSFAIIRHAAQLYNDEVPYVVHLQAVVDVLTRFGYTDPAILSAAWLHDIIEDTNTSYHDVKSRFGVDVAEYVYAATSELGRNRAERNKKTYPKLAEAPVMARVLKLADRIANIEYGHATGGKGDMYAKEYPDFEQTLRYAGTCDCQGRGQEHRELRDPELAPIWNYLDQIIKR